MAVNTLTGPRVSRLPRCLFTVWMVVRFVCVIRVPMCARVSRDLTQRQRAKGVHVQGPWYRLQGEVLSGFKHTNTLLTHYPLTLPTAPDFELSVVCVPAPPVSFHRYM